MAGDNAVVRRDAVLLRNDSIGVATEDKPREVQSRTNQNGYRISLNPEWVQQINIEGQSVHSVSLGVKPVIVQNPAIIIQPVDVLNTEP